VTLRLTRTEARASYAEILKETWFLKFFTAQGFSALGDWIGMIAILALVKRITDNEFAVAAMLLARLGPALLFGPVAGVIVDRWDRKLVMVFCDLGRATLIVTLPFIESIAPGRGAQVVVLFLISAALEMLTLLWQPAKDASLPRMVPRHQLTIANSLMLFAAYGTFPLSGVAFGLLVPASKWLGESFEVLREFRLNEEHLAFFFDSFTFAVSGAITATLAIPLLARTRQRLNLRRVRDEFVEGVRFIRRHPRIRPWLLGIGMIFFGVGAFLALAVFFVTDVLGAGSAGFGLMVTAVGIGLGAGFALTGVASRLVAKDVLFSASVFGLGGALIAFASASTLTAGLPIGAVLGLLAGLAYPSGLTLVQEDAADELRGRVMSSTHVVVRLALVGSLALAPLLAGIIGNSRWILLGQVIDLRGVRVIMWAGGLAILAAGIVTSRAVVARWRAARLAPAGLFLVFEGGEGAGKTTQMGRLASFLESIGQKVLVTREPGGTAVGNRIREILLDPASKAIADKAEALLYAADRAQHVEEVIRPALEEGTIVISDRYLDSSLAYQGLARGLGLDAVSDLNRWATAGLLPDLVFLLDTETELALRRSTGTDRIEGESLAFHERVRSAYQALSMRYPERFHVLDATGTPEEVAAEVRRRVTALLELGQE
jgi:dTMP kinase